MTTFTISLPNQLADHVDRETVKRGFATRSEFIRDLLRRVLYGDMTFEPFTTKPLGEIKKDLKNTGKYNQSFINSVVAGLQKSSLYEHQTTKR